MLYTSGTTGRPKGVPRSHRADYYGSLFQVVQQGYGYGDRTLGVMPLYHTMGIHSLISMHLIGGCFVSQARWDVEEGAPADPGAADHVALPRSHALLRPRPPSAGRRLRTLVGRSALLRRCRDDERARRALRRGVPAATLRQLLRLDRDLHVLDPSRPGGEAGLRGPPVAGRAAAARRERRDPLPHGRGHGLRRATGSGRTPTSARFATAGTTRATSAASTRTAISGCSAASTT